MPGEPENGCCIPGSLWLWKIPGKLDQGIRYSCAGPEAGGTPRGFAREEATVPITSKIQAQLHLGAQAMISGFLFLSLILSSSPVPNPPLRSSSSLLVFALPAGSFQLQERCLQKPRLILSDHASPLRSINQMQGKFSFRGKKKLSDFRNLPGTLGSY